MEKDNPFSELHTANYRGHIAYWKIVENKQFLKEIRIDADLYTPEEFKIRSKNPEGNKDGLVFTD